MIMYEFLPKKRCQITFHAKWENECTSLYPDTIMPVLIGEENGWESHYILYKMNIQYKFNLYICPE